MELQRFESGSRIPAGKLRNKEQGTERAVGDLQQKLSTKVVRISELETRYVAHQKRIASAKKNSWSGYDLK